MAIAQRDYYNFTGPWRHDKGSGVQLTVAEDTAAGIAIGGPGPILLAYNHSEYRCWVEFGLTELTAEAAVAIGTGFCVPPYSQVALEFDPTIHLYVAGICNSGETAYLELSTGQGK